MKLKTSCASLSEEELAKLSVNLLNCQSAIEGRTEYPCTQDMNLKSCTSGMNPETWNAYHVISNRARAVCYASRQQQFRALSEMTVNKLMSTAHSHINVINSLQDKQEKMENMALLTMNELGRGTRDVMRVHNAIRYSQSSIKQEIDQHLELLEKEKDYILQIQDRLSALTDKLDGKLEEANNQLTLQSDSRRQRQAKLLDDFEQLSQSALKVSKQIEKSAKTAEEHNRMSEKEFKTTLEALREINASIAYVSELAQLIREQADSKYGYLNTILGANWEELDRAIVVSVHVVSLLVFIIVSIYLNVPNTSRWLLLVAAPLNLFFALRQAYKVYSLEVLQLYSALTLASLVDLTVRWSVRCYSSYKKRTKGGTGKKLRDEAPPENNEATSNNSRGDTHVRESHSKVNSWLTMEGITKYDSGVPSANGYGDISYVQTPLGINRDEDNRSTASEYIRRRLENGSTSRLSVGGSSMSSNRALCLALKKNGQRCKLASVKGGLYCHMHATIH